MGACITGQKRLRENDEKHEIVYQQPKYEHQYHAEKLINSQLNCENEIQKNYLLVLDQKQSMVLESMKSDIFDEGNLKSIQEEIVKEKQIFENQENELINERVIDENISSVNMNKLQGSYSKLKQGEGQFSFFSINNNKINEDIILTFGQEKIDNELLSLVHKYETIENETYYFITDQPQNKQNISTCQEWMKQLQKLSIQTKKDQFSYSEIYKEILKLSERQWYEELVSLYKEQQLRQDQLYQGLNFEKKVIQLQEHFNYFVSAVVNDRFNNSNSVLRREYMNSDQKVTKRLSEVTKQSHQEIENWSKGFIYKGVYFKKISKSKSKQFKQEFQALKYLMLEYLSKGSNFDDLNILMPLMSVVESGFWVFFGTPVIYRNNNVTNQEEMLSKIKETIKSFCFEKIQTLIPLNQQPYYLIINVKNCLPKLSSQGILYLIPHDIKKPMNILLDHVSNGIEYSYLYQLLNIPKEKQIQEIQKIIQTISFEYEILHLRITLISLIQTELESSNLRASRILEAGHYQGVQKKFFFFQIIFKSETLFGDVIMFVDKIDGSMSIHPGLILPYEGQPDQLSKQIEKAYSNQLDLIVKDINNQKAIQNFETLAENLKRKFLKQCHLWIIYIKVSNNHKKLIACMIIVNIFHKICNSRKGQTNFLTTLLGYFFQGQNIFETVFCFRSYSLFPFLHYLTSQQINYILSSQFLEEIFQVARNSSQLMLQAIEWKFQVGILPELYKNIRSDWQNYFFKTYQFDIDKDIQKLEQISSKNQNIFHSIELKNYNYFPIRERAYFILLKQHKINKKKEQSAEIYFPTCFYRYNYNNDITQSYKNRYSMINSEQLNDWINYLEVILNQLQCVNFDQQLIIEALLIQITQIIFQDNDEDQAMYLMEKVFHLMNSLFYCSPQLLIISDLLMGFLLEKKQFVESQHNYIMSVLLMHNFYGDPRGRGSYPLQLELFPLMRLSVIAHLQNKFQDYETLSELIDAVQLTSNTVNPPFSHWANHYNYQDKSKSQAFNQSISLAILYPWLLKQITGLFGLSTQWSTYSVKEYYLKIFHNSYQPAQSSISSAFSNVSEFNNQKTLSQSTILQLSLTSILNQDQWTVQNVPGQLFVWGSNSNGQLALEPSIKFYQPRLLIQLKNEIVTQVACGHNHTLAIIHPGTIYSWGNNEYGKCGHHPRQKTIYSPQMIQFSNQIIQIKCGHDHSMGLTISSEVYTWGCGDGGLLGTGSLKHQYQLQYVCSNIDTIQSGGLHNAAITKDGQLYIWGRGEGGQLGIKDIIVEANDIYIDKPSLVNIGKVKQVALGDAHSLALLVNGQIYGWGYCNVGQLGIGVNEDNFLEQGRKTYIFNEPILIDTFKGMKITKIFAGSMTSMFINDRNELFSCGINDGYQCGVDKKYQTDKPTKVELIETIMNLNSGQNHSIAQGLIDGKQYAIYSWGINKQGELGISDINSTSSLPKVILETISYSMACGGYHTCLVSGDAIQYTKQISSIKNSSKFLNYTIQKLNSNKQSKQI